MKTIVVLILLIISSAVSGQKKPHGTVKSFHANDSLHNIKQYNQGKPIGNWMTYNTDSTQLIDIYQNNLLMHEIRLNKTGDTLNQKRFLYTNPSYQKLKTTLVYHQSKLVTQITHSYIGKDSIIEKPDLIHKIDSDTPVLVPAEVTGVSNPGQTHDSVSYYLDEVASFKGGIDALNHFIVKNTRYPSEAAKNGVKGRVVVRFLIKTDGKVSEVKIIQSSGSALLDQEAIRIIKKSSGKWIPGKVKGKSVNSYVQIPITFELDE